MTKRPLLAGTLLLTLAGLLSRVLGFFYRIFLSRTIGAEGLGIYQMLFPIHGIAFALCAGPIQTSISRLTAANPEKGKAIFRTGLTISLTIAMALLLSIRSSKAFLAAHVLLESRCEPLLPVMALSIPFSAIHACICGYYYGQKRTAVPALSQLVEQCIRMGAVFLIARVAAEHGKPLEVSLAVWGMLFGEAGSAIFSFLVYSFASDRLSSPEDRSPLCPSADCPSADCPSSAAAVPGQKFSVAAPLMAMALPLMGNRLILNCLQSMEAIFVPNKLLAFGLSSSEAISTYGILTGMALPFILFPSAITNSLAVILLPTVSEAQAMGDQERIEYTIAMALRYSLSMGILCIGIFTLFGEELGLTVYQNRQAGIFMSILAWLCPFMYLSTTMGSILNGLGKTASVFLHHAISMLLILTIVVFAIPRYGIHAYLAGLLLGELVLAALHIHTLSATVPVRFHAAAMLVKPSLCLIVSIGILKALLPWLIPFKPLLPAEFLFVLGKAGLLTLLYGTGLLLLHPLPVRFP